MRDKDRVILKEDCRLYHLVERLENDRHAVAQGVLRLLIMMDVREKLLVMPKKKLDKKYQPYCESKEGSMTLALNGHAILHMLRRGHLGCSSRGGHCDPVALTSNDLKLIPRVFRKPDKVVRRNPEGTERLRLEIKKKIRRKTFVLIVTANRRFTRVHVVTYYNAMPLSEKQKLAATTPRVDVC